MIPTRVFISLFVLFSSRMSICFFITVSIPLPRFLICSLMMKIFSINSLSKFFFKYLNIFVTAALKDLFAKSVIQAISGLILLTVASPLLYESHFCFFVYLVIVDYILGIVRDRL